MLTFRKLMQTTALALGVAFLAAPLAAPGTAQAQFFDKPGFGGGFGYAPPPRFFHAPPPFFHAPPQFFHAPPQFFVPPPIYYAPPPRLYHPPPHVFYAPPPPRAYFGPRPYYGHPHGHRRPW